MSCIRMLLRLLVICGCARLIASQQKYTGNSLLGCPSNDTSSLNQLYINNGQRNSCRAYLIFKAQELYNSVETISTLMAVNPLELAQANNVSTVHMFEANKEVIVPVNCFSSGYYYQANTSYQIPVQKSTYFVIANNTYQGLSTCDALMSANPYGEFDLLGEMELQVPLRCACPTTNQTAQGIRYLLTYSISWEDRVPDISNRFQVTRESVVDANQLSNEDIFPFTTLLIPLKVEPLSSQTIVQNKTRTGSVPDDTETSRPNKVYIGIGIAVGGSLALCVGMIGICLLLCRKSAFESHRGIKGDGESKWISSQAILSEIADANYDQSLRLFQYDELKRATENFSSSKLIKGSVYLGEIKGRSVTIKRMRTNVSDEVKMLNRINHFNLTQLYGTCVNKGCSYLVYEYLENGSLQEWLKNENSRDSGSWKRRIQIALDVANGLHYLHNFIEPAYVHKDIKSSNVVLNKDLRAKITNFSLGKTAAQGTRNVSSTANIVGTRGYMAPEYITEGAVTTKLDIYSFGVVMLELLTGKDALTTQHGKEVSLRDEVITLMEGDNANTEVGNLVDPRLKGNAAMLFAARVLNLSIACVGNDPANRPSIDKVVSYLLNLQADLEKSQVHVS
ncbi:hypothetical protein QQ045_000393 [Rhodiola kirilowii]